MSNFKNQIVRMLIDRHQAELLSQRLLRIDNTAFILNALIGKAITNHLITTAVTLQVRSTHQPALRQSANTHLIPKTAQNQRLPNDVVTIYNESLKQLRMSAMHFTLRDLHLLIASRIVEKNKTRDPSLASLRAPSMTTLRNWIRKPDIAVNNVEAARKFSDYEIPLCTSSSPFKRSRHVHRIKH